MTRPPGFGAALVGALADRETRGRWATVGFVAIVLALATWWFQRGHDARGWRTDRPYADAPYYYAYLPSLALDHDVDLTDEYRVTMNWYRLGPTPTGKPGNVFGVGPALLSLPAFAAGHAAAVATDQRRDGFAPAELSAVMWMSVLLSTLAMVVYPLIARMLDLTPQQAGLFLGGTIHDVAQVVGAGYTLVRAGNALLDEVPDDWFTAGGTHAELEREKKSLVRAIKEIEFDRDTGKLSAADAAALLAAYRGRAIEVIKVLDQGATGLSPRERVLAELKARAQVDRQAGNAKAKAKAAKAGKGGKPATATAAPPRRSACACFRPPWPSPAMDAPLSPWWVKSTGQALLPAAGSHRCWPPPPLLPPTVPEPE